MVAGGMRTALWPPACRPAEDRATFPAGGVPLLPLSSVPAMHTAVLQRLPPGVSPLVVPLLDRLPLHVRLARPRRTKLGDHRPPGRGSRLHRISINDDLNPYAFMTTLLHELAHAAVWERHRLARRRILPHGAEWKQAFSETLAPVVGHGLLPADVESALRRAMLRPVAASCSDRHLALALARYDRLEPGLVRAEQLAIGTWFRVDTGMVLRAGRLLRTRRLCVAARTGAEYRVHGLAKVEPLTTTEVEALVCRGRRSGRSRGAVAIARTPSGTDSTGTDEAAVWRWR